MWDEVLNSGFKIKKSLIRRHTMKGNGIKGKKLQKGKSPNNFKARVSNPKKISSKRELL